MDVKWLSDSHSIYVLSYQVSDVSIFLLYLDWKIFFFLDYEESFEFVADFFFLSLFFLVLAGGDILTGKMSISGPSASVPNTLGKNQGCVFLSFFLSFLGTLIFLFVTDSFIFLL